MYACACEDAQLMATLLNANGSPQLKDRSKCHNTSNTQHNTISNINWHVDSLIRSKEYCSKITFDHIPEQCTACTCEWHLPVTDPYSQECTPCRV